jgi:hypothetical protein
MIMLRRRTVAGRSAIVAAVIGMLAITSLSGATATPQSALSQASAARASASAAPSSTASVSDGDTTCKPWGPSNLGLKCTGTYTGKTAFNPWTWSNISQQPVVTVSQTKDLTDQGVQINWSDFTPSLESGALTPNPTTLGPLYQVAIFECMGTNPDPSTGFGEPQCYPTPVGSSYTTSNGGPPNGVLENTEDTSPLPKCSSPLCDYSSRLNAFYKPKWGGGNPSTWVGEADFHVEAPTSRSNGGFFNCGPSTPCSLVIVPNWGGTPVYNSTTNTFSLTNTSRCGEHWIGDNLDPSKKIYKPDMLGDPNPNPMGTDGQGDLVGIPADATGSAYAASSVISPNAPAALMGASYACWSADRIVIPLSFAPTPSDCPNNPPAFYAEGSPMMETQMLQWQAGWCDGSSPVTLGYTSNAEQLARTDFLAGNQAGAAEIDMALVTLPATAAEQQASQRQFTYAPLANSGVGIAYVIDDPATGSQIERMVLNARLLAKLTTQSYTLQYGCTNDNPGPPWQPPPHASPSCDPAVVTFAKGTGTVTQSNPFSVFDDPEFVSLNKNCEPFGQPANYACSNASLGTGAAKDDFPTNNSGGLANDVPLGGFLPTVLEPDSDMTYDLTGYIAANPDAAAFLNGKTDPWDMHVNTNYLHVSYPTQAFTELDQGVTYPGGLPACPPSGCPETPDESMQASWNYVVKLDPIATDLLTDTPTADSPNASCSLPGTDICNKPGEMNLTTPAPEEFIGGRALLSVLDLGDIDGYLFPAAELVNGAGDAVGPTQASVEAAVNDMKTNPDGITQYFDYASTDPAAYPLTMVDYAMVPTCGVPSGTASAIADFLTKVATTGQTQGEAPGDMAPGYYPLTARQKAQTLKAAQEVKAQTCKSPPEDHTVDSGSSTPPASSGKTPGSHGSPPGGSPSIRHATTAAFGQKSADSGMAGLLLVLAIVVGVLLVLGGPTAWVITVTGRWPVVLRWVLGVRARLQRGLGRLAGLVIRRA